MKRASGLRIAGAIVLALGFGGCGPGPDSIPAASITATVQALGTAEPDSDPAEGDDPAQIEHDSPSWPQWGQNARHAGFLDVVGQKLERNLASVVYDPLVPEEVAAARGDLLVHYQVPLVHPRRIITTVPLIAPIPPSARSIAPPPPPTIRRPISSPS